MTDKSSGLLSKTSRKEQQKRLVEHIRLFTKHIENDNQEVRRFIAIDEEQPNAELTFGHALFEFCYARLHANNFIKK